MFAHQFVFTVANPLSCPKRERHRRAGSASGYAAAAFQVEIPVSKGLLSRVVQEREGFIDNVDFQEKSVSTDGLTIHVDVW